MRRCYSPVRVQDAQRRCGREDVAGPRASRTRTGAVDAKMVLAGARPGRAPALGTRSSMSLARARPGRAPALWMRRCHSPARVQDAHGDARCDMRGDPVRAQDAHCTTALRTWASNLRTRALRY
ncbi:hypothetical protein HWV62_30683 [Athelia sp. TMB]|nr:hypothetical protein HWV62_30683 [Athelia sp. TMB]